MDQWLKSFKDLLIADFFNDVFVLENEFLPDYLHWQRPHRLEGLTLVLRGELTLRFYNNRRQTFKAGSVILYTVGAFFMQKTEDCQLARINMVESQLTIKVLTGDQCTGCYLQEFPNAQKYQTRLNDYLNDMPAGIKQPVDRYRVSLKGRLLLLELVHQIEMAQANQQRKKSPYSMLHRITMLNGSYPFLNVSREELAELIGVTPQYINQAIKKRIGLSYQHYITLRKLEFSRQLLDQMPDLDTQLIGHEIGYTNYTHFINNFKKFYGVTPKQFRRQRQVEGPVNYQELLATQQTRFYRVLPEYSSAVLFEDEVHETHFGLIVANCCDEFLEMTIQFGEDEFDTYKVVPSARRQYTVNEGSVIKCTGVTTGRVRYFVMEPGPSMIIFHHLDV